MKINNELLIKLITLYSPIIFQVFYIAHKSFYPHLLINSH